MSELSELFSKALRDLSPEEQAKRTQIARFREVFDDIEAALKAGYPQAFVRGKLAECGLSVGEDSFRVMLKRVRGERLAAPPGAVAGQQAKASAPVPPSQPPSKPPKPLTAQQERDKFASQFIKPNNDHLYRILNREKEKALEKLQTKGAEGGDLNSVTKCKSGSDSEAALHTKASLVVSCPPPAEPPVAAMMMTVPVDEIDLCDLNPATLTKDCEVLGTVTIGKGDTDSPVRLALSKNYVKVTDGAIAMLNQRQKQRPERELRLAAPVTQGVTAPNGKNCTTFRFASS